MLAFLASSQCETETIRVTRGGGGGIEASE